MKSTFRVLFFLKRDKVKKNGNMPIMARVTIDGKLAQFNTKLEGHVLQTAFRLCKLSFFLFLFLNYQFAKLHEYFSLTA